MLEPTRDPTSAIRTSATPAFVTVALSAVLVVMAIAYWPAIGGPFLLDDFTNVPQTRLDRFSFSGLLDVVTSNGSGPLGRPVPVLTFALNYLFGDGSVSAFKLTNLALHALNVMLVYCLCRLLLPLCAPRASTGATPDPATVALLVAAVWAIHPLQLSTVMYVVQRMTILMTSFTLASLVLYSLMRHRQIFTTRRGIHLVPIITLSTGLACLSKENGALVLVHILLLELLVFRFRMQTDSLRKRFVGGFVPSVVFPVVLGVALALGNIDVLMGGYAERDFGPVDRLMTQPSVILLYMKMALLPNLSDMSFYHDYLPVIRQLTPQVVLQAIAIGALASSVPLLARRAPPIALGIGLFLVSHLLESTFLPLDLAFEHRNYFGLLGLCLPLAWYAVALAKRRIASSMIRAGGVILLALLTLQTFNRALEWSSDLSLNALAFENRPESRRARTNLFVSMARRERFPEAAKMVGLNPLAVPADAALLLVATQMLALEDIRDETLLEQAEEALAEGTVTPDVNRMLRTLHENGRAGVNGPLGDDALLSLHEAALSNPRRPLQESDERGLRRRHAELMIGGASVRRGAEESHGRALTGQPSPNGESIVGR